jgi:hypothetical protein
MDAESGTLGTTNTTTGWCHLSSAHLEERGATPTVGCYSFSFLSFSICQDASQGGTGGEGGSGSQRPGTQSCSCQMIWSIRETGRFVWE